MIQKIDNITYVTFGELPYGMTMEDAAASYWQSRQQAYYYSEALKLLTSEQKEELKRKTIEWTQSERKQHADNNKEITLFPRVSP